MKKAVGVLWSLKPKMNGEAIRNAPMPRSSSAWTSTAMTLTSESFQRVLMATTRIAMPAMIDTAVAALMSLKPKRNGAAISSATRNGSLAACTSRGMGP